MKNACVPKISVFAPIDGKLTGKNNRFLFLDILGFLKNTHKNTKFGRVRQVPTSLFFKYSKISNIGNLIFFPVEILQS